MILIVTIDKLRCFTCSVKCFSTVTYHFTAARISTCPSLKLECPRYFYYQCAPWSLYQALLTDALIQSCHRPHVSSPPPLFSVLNDAAFEQMVCRNGYFHDKIRKNIRLPHLYFLHHLFFRFAFSRTTPSFETTCYHYELVCTSVFSLLQLDDTNITKQDK